MAQTVVKEDMKTFINRENLFYRFQQLIIVILHLILLKWMFYALTESGSMTTQKVLLHFTGMAVFGGLLIRSCAAWGKWHFEKEKMQLKQDQENGNTNGTN